MRIRTFALAACALALAACSSNSSTTGGSSGGSTGSTGGSCTAGTPCACTSDSDCASLGNLWICDTEQTKTCIFQCNSASDCTGSQAPDDVKSACSASTLGCTCDLDATSQLSTCNTKGCGTDADCPGGNVCQSGQCVSSQVATVSACSVFPEFVALNAGEAYKFTVQAYNGSTPVHITDADVTWSSTSSSITNSGATFTVSSSAAATAAAPAIKATIHGTVNCTANVQIYPANSSGVRVTVLDALAGVPLGGAVVYLDSTNSSTSEDGTTSFTTSTSTPHTISVFAPGFDYVTIYQTKATDLLIPLTRDADANLGGVTGQVSNLFQANSKIHAGFVGMSIPGSITDVSLTLLEGPSESLCDNPAGCKVSSFDLGGINVPSGVLMGLNDQNFKDHFLALGAAGWCANPDGSENTEAVTAGTCGNRGIWGLAGDIDLDKVSPLIDQISGGGGLSNLNIGGILGSLLPVLRNFNSLVQRDQPITLGPADSNAPANTPISANLASVSLDNTPNGNNAVKLSLAMKVKVPVLPHYPTPTSSTFADGAIVLGASDVPGRGLFPLGMTAGLDNDGTSSAPADVDGHVSYIDSNTQQQVKDLVNLNMAPAHHGTESGSYRMAVLASSFSNISAGLVGSGIVVNPGSCSNGTGGICYGSTIDVSGQSFMDFPQGSSFDYASRTFTVGTLDSHTKLARLDFHDGADHRWFVYFDPSSATTVNVPAAPQGFDDRTRSDDTATGPRSTLLALNLELTNGATADNAYSFGNPNASLLKLDKYINRFVIKDYPAPTIKITSPNPGTGVTGGSSSVTVSISGDDINNNAWMLCSTSANTPITNADLSSCTSGGPVSSGQATANVPASPTGSVYVHAVLVDGNGALLNPSVEDSEQLNVQ